MAPCDTVGYQGGTILTNTRDFAKLANEWRRDTAVHSSSSIIYGHPAYQKIIAMGKEALPLILDDLSRTADQWFGALREITGTSPVKDEDRGNISAMKRAWLDWGLVNGYLRTCGVCGERFATLNTNLCRSCMEEEMQW